MSAASEPVDHPALSPPPQLWYQGRLLDLSSKLSGCFLLWDLQCVFSFFWPPKQRHTLRLHTHTARPLLHTLPLRNATDSYSDVIYSPLCGWHPHLHPQLCTAPCKLSQISWPHLRATASQINPIKPGPTPYSLTSINSLTITQDQCVKSRFPGFHGGAVVKNPPANAGDTGSSPGLGRSHMPRSNEAREPQLLSLRSRAREPQLLKPACLGPVLRNERSHRNENPCTATKSRPCSPQLEKAHAQQLRPNTAKNK